MVTRLAPFEGKQIVAAHPPPSANVIAFEGSIRSSKTIVSLVMWADFVRRAPSGNLLMVGRTIDVLIRNLLEPMVELYGRRRVSWNRSLGTATVLGRRLYIMGANDAKARAKVQGLTLVGAYVDEATNVPEEFFEMLDTRLSEPGARLFLTCNPEGPKHWLLVKWLARARWWVRDDGTIEVRDGIDAEGRPWLDWYRVTFVLADNVWLSRTNPGFVERLKASHVGVFYQRMILSRWVSAEGMVYPDFDADRHTIGVADVPPIEAVLSVGADYGTNHRTRAYAIGLGRYARTRAGDPIWNPTPENTPPGSSIEYGLFVLSEFAPDTATVGEHAAAFQRWLEAEVNGYGIPEYIAVDPAAAVFKAELHARGGHTINAHNAVVPGIQVVQALLTTGRMWIVREKCPVLIDMIPAYVWDTKATERGDTKPLKENDDEADALRYGVYTVRRSWRDLIPLGPIDNREPDMEDGGPVD